jgi:CRISPR-associated endonuclease/helicase Cas3
VADLQMNDFPQFFFHLHGTNPFPWQEALAQTVCTGDWPEVIDLPTASGKTACIDIALFALALRGAEAPRRIFFVVDRRVVVNEAYLRMKGICKKLGEAETGVLGAVAGRLRRLAGGDAPLHVYEMRGGAFRDETWVKNPLQPTVVASTVDQVGSRLLFRGYGVSDYSWPLHAGLIGNDALMILDEAHSSRAFAQTLQRVEQYRGDSWADDPIRAPFRFVEMTATPSRESGQPYRITDADRSNEVFGKRLHASKPTRLVEQKGRTDDFTKLAEKVISEATELADEADAKRIAILVNRVRTAKIVHDRLREKVKEASVELVIGRMRPVDRDDLYEQKLKRLKSDVPRQPEDPLTFVVSTQCLEVGADLDFDVLVSECASIDALQQRFGRLDRLGQFGRARGAIVIGSWQVNPKRPDPVYGEALSKTWEWLKGIGGESADVNMGIEPRHGEAQTVAELLKSTDSQGMRLYGEDAPILLPAHLDALAQTSPVPEPEPSAELFLHGPERGAPDVQVVWRADLDEENPQAWQDIATLRPPSSREAMPVQIYAFKKWFAGEKNADGKESDLAFGAEEDEPEQKRQMRALAWRGDDSELITDASQVRPGQTLVLPAAAEGWNELGYIPEGVPEDVADRAAFDVRRRTVSLRLHTEVIKEWPQTPALKAVAEYASTDGAEPDEMQDRLKAYLAELDVNVKRWPYPFLSELNQRRRKRLNAYPGQDAAYVLEARRSDESQQPGERVLLERHLADVECAVGEATAGLDGKLSQALKATARFHDYGKADVRYQAWLFGGDLMAAQYAPKPVAKSGNDPVGRQAAVGLPRGFRHELLSLVFAERSDEVKGDARDLILHLIASHHGRCRPFAPVISDEGAEFVSYGGISLCKQERIEHAPYRLDREVADRFWRLTRKYGWWGLAYLEALFRLADWRASEMENAEAWE